jgi:hypothetical protein
LIGQGILSKYIAGVWFLYRLPTGIAAKVIQKYKIDTEDPGTVDYNRIREFVAKATSSEKAIQQLNRKKVADSSQKYKIKELADYIYTRIGIPKKKETFKILFGPIAILLQTTKGNKAIKELAKLFNQLNLNIGIFIQRVVGLSDRGYQGPQRVYLQRREGSVGGNSINTVDIGIYRS